MSIAERVYIIGYKDATEKRGYCPPIVVRLDFDLSIEYEAGYRLGLIDISVTAA